MHRSTPKVFLRKRIWFLIENYWDLCAICYILWCLMLNAYTFRQHKAFNSPWWEFPLSDGWNANGKIPKYGSYLNSSVLFEFKVNDNTMQDYLRLPKKNKEDNNSGKEKIILFSHPPFGETKPYPVDTNKCGGRCIVSYNTSLFHQAEAVMFHFTDPRPMPPRTFPHQLYVWINLESPPTTISVHNELPGTIQQLGNEENVFNLTMTYRRDSSIYFPYFTLSQIREKITKIEEVENVDLLMKSKTKLAAWVSGNCLGTKAGITRFFLIKTLQKLGLDIDIYGRCVDNPLPGIWENLPEQIRTYKFYFACENSLHCRDYITEKMWWNALLAGAVPVIWGPMKKDVEAVLPQGSYVFVEDYETPQDLIDYLNYLDSNSNAYRQHFNWRSVAVPERIPGRLGGNEVWKTSEVVGFCQLCHMLYDDDRYEKEHYGLRPRRVIQSLATWWFEEETKTCLTPMNSKELVISKLCKTIPNTLCRLHSFIYLNCYFFVCIVLVMLLLLNRRLNCATAIRTKFSKNSYRMKLND